MINNPIAQPIQKKQLSPNWYLVTGHLNLSYLMGAGLIFPENGFGEKYFKDVLSMFPGRIVLFVDTVPAKAIEMVKEEASHLIPCIAEVNLDTLTGSVISIDRLGNIRQNFLFPDELTGNEAALIIPAPLPISWLDKIYFESRIFMGQFKESADDFNNMDCRNFTTKVNKKLFEKPKKDKQLFETPEAFPWPRAKDLIKEVPTCFNRAIAAGGVMAILHKIADRSRSAAIAFQFAFGLDPDVGDIQLDPLIHRPWQWIQEDLIPAKGEALSTKMIWGMVDAIAACNGVDDMKPKAAVFNFLKNVVDTWQGVSDNQKLKNALQNLIQELRRLLSGISDSTISELLDRHPKPFSRAVILFFLRDNCREFLEYYNEKLNESDIIAAAILFGAREGWLGLPNDLRGNKTLQYAVVHRMAAMAHHVSNSDIGLGAAPPPAPIFRELFKPVDNKWTVKQKNAAFILSKHKHWECIQTFIDLGKGEYQLNVGSTGVQIVIAGTEKNVTHAVDRPSFLKQLDRELTKQDITGRLNQDLRKIFGCIQ